MADADSDAPGVPEWVVTYGDMMSLLLTFFIMLVSMSEMKQDGRVRAMLDSLQARFGVGMGTQGVPGSSLQHTGVMEHLSSEGMTSDGDTKRSGRTSAGPAGAQTTVQRLAHGSVVTLGGPTGFPPRRTDVGPGLKRELDVLVEMLRDRPNRIVVRGHAAPDDAPPADAGPDEPDLLEVSLRRARSVAAHLADRGVDRRRIVVQGAGATEPYVVTRDDRRRHDNRRVDVFVVDSYTTPRAPTEGDAETTPDGSATSDPRDAADRAEANEAPPAEP